MKTLILIRHAKSSWDDDSLEDKQRPLNDRGLRDAPVMGKRLKRQAKHGDKPDLILSSPAIRAVTTAELIADEIGYPRRQVKVNDQLYDTSADELLAVIRELDDRSNRVMLVSHNPALVDLAGRLTSGKITRMPTCGVVTLEYGVQAWSSIGEAKPGKVKFDSPKDS